LSSTIKASLYSVLSPNKESYEIMVEHPSSCLDIEENSSSSFTCSVPLVEVAYLNNAGQARLHPNVQRAGVQAIESPPWKSSATSSDPTANVRKLYAQLIEAPNGGEDIAIMPSTAFAITLAANNLLTLSSKVGRVLVLQDQMCSAVYPWQHVCNQSNGRVQLEIVSYPAQGQDWTEQVVHQLNQHDDYLAACLPPLHWSDGALLDLEKIGEVCRKRSVSLIVDATQAVGIMPCSVAKIQPTLLACSIHKWLRAPSGISLVYVTKAVHDSWQPLDQHGHSRDPPFDASANDMGTHGYPERFLGSARKFDSGGKPNPILVPMLQASLEQVAQLNIASVQDQLTKLIQPILGWVKSHPEIARLPHGPFAPHLFGIHPNNNVSREEMIKICTAMQKEDQIIIAVRSGAFRISSYVDNTADHIQRLIEALDRRLSHECREVDSF
jgi:selenocysteine lyase/cysteine desulfurase